MAALGEATRGQIQPRLGKQPLRSAHWADAFIELKHQDRKHQFACTVKPQLDLPGIQPLAAHMAAIGRDCPHPIIVVTRFVNPKVADTMIEQGMQFLDTAGNAYLEHRDLCVIIRGQRLPRALHTTIHPESRTTWTRGALPIVHRLLNHTAALELPLRDLAALSSVSLGTVHNTFAELKSRGFIRTIGKRARLVERSRLFEQWVASYPQYLRPRLLRRRLVIAGRPALSEIAQQMQQALGEREWVFSGEAAAWLMDRYLRPETLTLYGNGDLEDLCDALGARPAADGPIEVLQAFWAGPTSPGGGVGLADPILVYADLVYIGDPRARDAALRIRDDHLQLEAPTRG